MWQPINYESDKVKLNKITRELKNTFHEKITEYIIKRFLMSFSDSDPCYKNMWKSVKRIKNCQNSFAEKK